jgi:Chain length determinant protein
MTDSPSLPEHDDEISLLDLLVTLAESWKLLVFGPLLAGVLAGGLSFLWPKTFESTAIARLTEEEAALFHAAPVLDPLADKFGYLAQADGVRDDARAAVKKDLVYSVDKKTKLVTLISKGHTPEQAQALGHAAFDALFVELVPKAKEKEAILQEMAINNQLIAEGVLYADRSANKNTPNAASTPNTPNTPKSQIANLKLNNLELSLKLQSKGREVFAQEPSLPQRKSAPKRSLVVMLTVLATGVALLLCVFVRKAWAAAAQNAESASKVTAIRRSLGFKF